MRIDDKANPATPPAPASEAAPAAQETNPFAVLDEEQPPAMTNEAAQEEEAAAEAAPAEETPAEEKPAEDQTQPAAAKPGEEKSDAAKMADEIAKLKCKDDDKECLEKLDTLYWDRRKLVSILQLSASATTNNFYGLAGEPMERAHGSFGVTFDFLTKTYENGLRFLAGAYFRGFTNNMAAGARLGFAVDINKALTLKVPFGLGWFKVNGIDDDAGTVPIELTGTGVNADQTAYTFAPHDVYMTMQAGMLSFDPELFINFYRWKLGGGKTVGLGAFVALSAALYTGAVSDDECSYAYDPSEGDLEVRPDAQGNYEFTNTATLTDRCRANEPSFGVALGASAGLNLDFGL